MSVKAGDPSVTLLFVLVNRENIFMTWILNGFKEQLSQSQK